MTRDPVVVQVLVLGSYTSADAKVPVPPLLRPPTAKILPLGSSTIWNKKRAVAREAVLVQVAEVGLYTSADAR